MKPRTGSSRRPPRPGGGPHHAQTVNHSDRRSARRRRVRAAALVVSVVVSLGVALLTWWTARQDDRTPQPQPAAGTPYPTFASDNVFEVEVTQAPVDRRSDAMIENLLGQIEPHYNGIAALNVHEFHQSLWVAQDSTPPVTVRFEDCQDKGYVPDDLFNGRRQFVDVPIPPGAQPAEGSDRTLSVWSPSQDRLWEFWIAQKEPEGWSACWGGRIDEVSQNRGYFTAPFGASASGLVTVGTMITVPEARERNIEHAMALTLIAPARWDRVRYPAQRSDGYSTDPAAIPEGARLRLDPQVDVESLGLTPLGAAIARAAQRYGFIVVDQAGAVAVITESGQATQARTGTDPWPRILGDVPAHEQLRNFPWERMQVLAEGHDAPSTTPSDGASDPPP